MTANFEILRNIIAMQLTFEAWRPTSHRQLDKQTLFGVVARPKIKKKNIIFPCNVRKFHPISFVHR